MNIPNWDGTENQVMKGYILKAVHDHNKENPSREISQEVLNDLMNALHWATDDMTAEEAYYYYLTH